MNDQATEQGQAPLEQLIHLVEQALAICDKHDFIFAGIHICAAIEVLKAQKFREIGLPTCSDDATK